jgi:hypothetical protein
MSVKRLGIVRPTAEIPSLLTDVGSNYFVSVIITNLNQIKEANLTVYVKPFEVTDPDEYSYVIYNFPLARANSLETNRFALNPLDEVWVESSIDDVSFMAMGIPQSVIAVRYSVGPTENRPTTPQPGDQYYNTTSNTLELYKPTGWVTVTTS